MKRLDEHSQWEKEWAATFRDESQKPAESVWQNLDAVLANKEAKKYKKRAFYYKWLAAASVLFSVCGAILLLQNNSQGFPQDQTAARPTTGVTTEEAIGLSSEEQEREREAKERQLAEAGQYKVEEETATAEEVTEVAGFSGDRTNEQPKALAAVENDESRESTLLAGLAEKGQGQRSLVNVKKIGFVEESIKTEVTAKIQKVWLASDMLKKKEDALPKYLLGASLSSNYFNPNYQDNNALVASMTKDNALNPKKGQMSAARVSEWDVKEENPVTLNGGVQAAAWIGKKWVLQSGIQYGNYKSAGQAGSYVDPTNSQAYPLHYANFSADKVQTIKSGSRISAPVSVVNSFEFISVPVSIGYVVFDRKLGLMVSPGLSSEFFLSNQLSSEGQGLSTYTVYGGEESPYNRVHLRGLIGAQLYYKLGEHYMISIEPSYQQSVTDFNKSESYFSSRPTNMGISAGFRYIIR